MVMHAAGRSKIVYISISQKNFGHRFRASSMAKDLGFLPVYPNIVSDLTKAVEAVAETSGPSRDAERLDQIRKASEVWVIGVAEGEMKEDVELAKRFGKRLRYFEVEEQSNGLIEVEK
jgi:hypothetical protein